MATREQVMIALFTLLQRSGNFVTVGRRLFSPESIGPAQSPALFLAKALDRYERPSPALPPKRVLTAKAFFYNDIGSDKNAIPETAINNALDQLDGLMAPDSPQTGRFTLGGLVFSCMISGEAKAAPGDVTGKSIAIVPIEVILP